MGAATESRLLIVNADDFGMTAAVNEGIAVAHTRGIVTGASLMVRQGAAEGGARLAAAMPALAVGLHLDLELWEYERGAPCRGARCDLEDPASVERESGEQLARFRELLGRDPTHLDSHHNLHMREPLASVARRMAAELEVPLRARGIRYEGGFFGRDADGGAAPGAIGVAALVGILRRLPGGVTEVGCHPGLEMAGGTSYAEERSRELETLCDPAVRQAIEDEGIRLTSFAELCRHR